MTMKALKGQVCGLRGIDSWTTKAQMSAVKLYTAQGGRLTHLEPQTSCTNKIIIKSDKLIFFLFSSPRRLCSVKQSKPKEIKLNTTVQNTRSR